MKLLSKIIFYIVYIISFSLALSIVIYALSIDLSQNHWKGDKLLKVLEWVATPILISCLGCGILQIKGGADEED